MYVLNNNVTYFESFGVEYIAKEIKIFIDQSIDVTNVFRMQAYDSIMCEYLDCICIGFIETLTDFANVFLPNNFK